MDAHAPALLRDLHEALRAHLGMERANDWARHARFVSLDESTVVFTFPDTATRARLEAACRPPVQRALSRLMNRNVRAVFTVEPAFFPCPTPLSPFGPRPAGARAPSPLEDGRHQTFATFILGTCNQLAGRAALRFAETGGREYPALFLAGPAGCGKTHLLRAIHHALLTQRRSPSILLLPAPRFQQQFVYALQRGLIEPFRRKYRTAEILLLDDVHLLATKPRTQEELLHTFDTLLDHGCRFVLTSDRPAHAIDGLNRPLQARLQSALEIRVDPPDPATRLAWLRSRAAAAGFDCPDTMLAYIADRVETHFHDLARCLEILRSCEGDLRARAHRAVDSVRQAWGDAVTVQEIAQRVGEHFGLKIADLHGDRKTRTLVDGRRLCFYLGRKHTPLTLDALGKAFGGRDHATVHLSVRSVEERIRKDRGFERLVRKLEQALGKA